MDVPFAALAPIVVLVLAFVVYCLIDLARSAEVRVLPRWAWAILVLISMPFGGFAYLVWGRPS